MSEIILHDILCMTRFVASGYFELRIFSSLFHLTPSLSEENRKFTFSLTNFLENIFQPRSSKMSSTLLMLSINNIIEHIFENLN